MKNYIYLLLLILCIGCSTPTYEHIGCEFERGDVVRLPNGSRGVVDRIVLVNKRSEDEWKVYVLCKHRELRLSVDVLTLESKFDFDNDPTYKVEWKDGNGYLLEPPKFIPPSLPPAKTPYLPSKTQGCPTQPNPVKRKLNEA